MASGQAFFTRHLSVRRAVKQEDGVCGRLASEACLAAGLHQRLPHAAAAFHDRSPLPCKQGTRLIAQWHGEPAGFVDFDVETGRIDYLFVHPHLQNRGIGSLLLDRAERALGGKSSVEVLAVNRAALRIYLRRGYRFRRRDVDPDWHGGTTVWITLVLD